MDTFTLLSTSIATLVFLATGALIYSVFASKPTAIQERLQNHSAPVGGSDELEGSFGERIVLPMLQLLVARIIRATPGNVADATRDQLVMAGRPISPTTYLALKVIFLVVLPGIFVLVLVAQNSAPSLIQLITLGVLVIVSYKLPGYWLDRKIKSRKDAIQRALPDTLDLITVSIEAGLAMDAALASVSEKMKGPLADEFRQVLSDMNLGRMRRDALRDFGVRTGVATLQSFLAAVIQADQTGISVGQVLRVQSDQIRVKRKQRAQEAAMKLPTKMLFPLILCIMPATFIVILGPAGMSIYNSFLSA